MHLRREMRVHGTIRRHVSASSGCWPGNILVKLSLGDLLYSRRNKLNKKVKDINRSRKAAGELARRTRARHWVMTLVFLWVQEEVRSWAHKNLYLKTSDSLKAGSSGFFPEHSALFLISTLTYFQGMSAACSGHDVIFVEIAGKCQLLVSRVPS